MIMLTTPWHLWNSLKTLKLQGKERATDRQAEIHRMDGYATGPLGLPSGQVQPPRMTITAIGTAQYDVVKSSIFKKRSITRNCCWNM